MVTILIDIKQITICLFTHRHKVVGGGKGERGEKNANSTRLIALLFVFARRPTPRQVSIPVDSPVNGSTMVPSGDFASDSFGLVGPMAGSTATAKSRITSNNLSFPIPFPKTSENFAFVLLLLSWKSNQIRECITQLRCLDVETPEPDEISGSGSSTQDVYSDIMSGVMGNSHVHPAVAGAPHQELGIGSSSAVLAELLPGHSRNSSGTSHSGTSGSASGYGSLASQSQHSRQSSSGELGHFRSVRHRILFSPFSRASSAYCRPNE